MAATKQTIQDFYRVAQARDFARDVQFRILSISPQGTTVKFDEDDLVYARAASLPSRQISNTSVPYMGLKFNVAGVASYPNSENYVLDFYADAKSILWEKFEQWTRDTFDDADSTGNYLTSPQNSTIDLIQLDNNFEKVNQYQLVGVSIRAVGDLKYGMAAGTGQFLYFTSNIAYHYFQKKD